MLDLYEGPHQATNRPGDPLYGARALERSRLALRPDGVLAIWSEEPDRAFELALCRRPSATKFIRTPFTVLSKESIVPKFSHTTMPDSRKAAAIA